MKPEAKKKPHNVALAPDLATRIREIQAARIKSGKPASFSAVLAEAAEKGIGRL